MAAERLTCSAVVPVYNSATTLPDLVRELAVTLEAAALAYEVILVNDGSRDQSWEVICALARERPEVKGINLMRNFGQHNALLCGIRAARYDVVVTLDDDLQNPPDQIPKLLARLAEGFDVVYGTPDRPQHGLWRNLATQATKFALAGFVGSRAAHDVSAFRAVRTSVRDAFTGFRGPYVCLDVLLAWGTTRFGSVPVRHEARRAGASQYTVRRLVTHALNLMTGFSTRPLQLASWIGFALTLFGAGLLALVLARYLLHGATVPGFPFLASVISIFSGAQLFALGVIGEYLARMHFRMLDQPTYVVRQETGR
jgi:undecaprenyl-phosphate 4-deoxy-4-formamido-L-arabinose transferase